LFWEGSLFSPPPSCMLVFWFFPLGWVVTSPWRGSVVFLARIPFPFRNLFFFPRLHFDINRCSRRKTPSLRWIPLRALPGVGMAWSLFFWHKFGTKSSLVQGFPFRPFFRFSPWFPGLSCFDTLPRSGLAHKKTFLSRPLSHFVRTIPRLNILRDSPPSRTPFFS